ncbi:GNAT family N-acetyltransferase [Empedobacter brevis]|uniref:GNAT family N-acetyltransferase n=1 Tax=Empedobacter brevis TaxID=247 RepID=UPI00123DFC4C|nr:GNAT family N-acetyltransferase [Empedobacter brevis]QES94027.1 GNAT family N-acetyltransferase [Empedobacter brevis]QHC85849.1 hypothetical protein AS589_14180 [Empedobacter brevis]
MEYTITFVEDHRTIETLVSFFIENKTIEFISHGEILSGRAHDLTTWNENLDQVLFEHWSNDSVLKIAILGENKDILGFAIAEIIESSLNKYLILDDIMIGEKLRGHSLGKKMVDFIIDFSKCENIKAILCESGINNIKAHSFLRKTGFEETSINFILPI